MNRLVTFTYILLALLTAAWIATQAFGLTSTQTLPEISEADTQTLSPVVNAEYLSDLQDRQDNVVGEELPL